jgi:hypothetical protein
MDNQLAQLRGDALERRYERRAGAYFSRLVSRSRVLPDQELVNLVDDAREAGTLSDAERDDLLLAELVVRGLRRADGQEVHLVIEVSVVIDTHDVRRAAERASFLARVRVAVPVVAGERITTDASELAATLGVETVIRPRPPDASDESGATPA